MDNYLISSNSFGDVVGIILYTTSRYNKLLLFIQLIIFCIGSLFLLKQIQLKNQKKWLAILIIPIFLLSPIRLRYSMEWPNHANWAWAIFYLTFLFMSLKTPFSKSLKYGFFSGVFFFIALSENAYHGAELFFVSIPLFIFSLIVNKSDIFKKENIKIVLRNFLIFASIVLASIYYQYYTYTRPIQYGNNEITTTISSASRSPSDRWAFSARPWHYLIPDIDHPVLGDLSTKAHYFIWSRKPYYLTEPFFPKEHTLFLGYTLLVLSSYTIYITYRQDLKRFLNFLLTALKKITSSSLNSSNLSIKIKNQLNEKSNNSLPKEVSADQRFTVTFFLIIAITAFIFSMPPYIGIDNFKIYFPSHFIYDFLPQFRAYARYGVLVFIGNAVLAIIGLEHLISKSFIISELKTTWRKPVDRANPNVVRSCDEANKLEDTPYVSAGSFINKAHQKLKQNLLAIAIFALAIFEFLPGKHLISITPTPPYEWLRKQSTLQQTPLKYIEIPERADYTDHLYTHKANIEIINPYLTTRGDAKTLEDIIWQRENQLIPTDSNQKDILFCDLSEKLNAKYLFYHEKELNKQKYVQEFMQTGVVTPQLKVAMAESWGQPTFGNHVPKTDEDLLKEQITKNMKNNLLSDPKLKLIKEYTNDEIIQSRPNKNFSADKFDAVTIFELNKDYCSNIMNNANL